MKWKRKELLSQIILNNYLKKSAKLGFFIYRNILKSFRAAKDTEVLNAVQSVKNMLLETINTKIESTQV